MSHKFYKSKDTEHTKTAQCKNCVKQCISFMYFLHIMDVDDEEDTQSWHSREHINYVVNAPKNM